MSFVTSVHSPAEAGVDPTGAHAAEGAVPQPDAGDAPAALTVSASAAARIAALGRAEGRPLMLRLSVEGGGCSGFQYQFDLVETADADDHRFERDGAVVLVDDVSIALLTGSVVDYVDELAGSEFRIRNPNARSSCGCGVSFSI